MYNQSYVWVYVGGLSTSLETCSYLVGFKVVIIFWIIKILGF